ncbi:MAG: class I SAM-dependent methyltransferase [Candidatus Micrarchaeota archaeon]
MPLSFRKLSKFFGTKTPPTRDDTAKAIHSAKRNAFDYKTTRGLRQSSMAHLTRIKTRIAKIIEETGATEEKPMKLLDIGCGSGQFAKEVKAAFGDLVEIHALDVTWRPQWKDIKGVKFRLGHAENLERFAPGYFDMVISTFGLCYTPDQLKALEQAQKVTKENGWIITHVHKGVLKRRQGTDVRKLAKLLGARVTHFPPIPGHPIYSIQFRKKAEVVPLSRLAP